MNARSRAVERREAIRDAGVALVAQLLRSGAEGHVQQEFTSPSQTEPMAACAAPGSGLFSLLRQTTELAERVRAQGQGGAAR